MKELVAEKPLERFIDRLKDVAALIKVALCQGGHTKEGEGARPDLHMYFSKDI